MRSLVLAVVNTAAMGFWVLVGLKLSLAPYRDPTEDVIWWSSAVLAAAHFTAAVYCLSDREED